ncbi:MAG: sigma-70 family RNA polymerase sigma factor [Armatimonas sp.]
MMPTSARSLWSLTKRVPPDPAVLREKYLAPLLAYTQRRLRNRDDAEDAVAEVFGAAYAALHRCPAPEWERAWLFGIARNKVADALKKRRKRAEVPLDSVAERSTPFVQDSELQEFLETLRPEWREVLLLKYVEGLSLAEIGRVVGKSDKAISSLLQRARAAAQQALSSEEES